MKNFKQSIFLPSSILENPTREPLNIILTPYEGITHVPSDIGTGSPATMVFIELNKCFEKAGYVAEGMLANVIWGFQECGYQPNAVASGLTTLRTLGYISYSDERGNPIHETNFDASKPVWIRYEPKMRELFVRKVLA